MSQENQSEALTVVTFENHPIPNAEKSKASGRPIYDEIELCRIKLAGNKQTVGAFPAHAFAPGWAVDQMTGERSQQTYAQKYNDQYLAFKGNGAQTQSGTPTKALDFLTPAKVLELKALNVHTVEALAAIDGTPLKQLGMHGREWKNKAIEYLKNATGPAALEVQRAANKEMQSKIDEMEAQIKALQSSNSGAQPSPFDDWDEADIKNWLKEAGVQVHHLWKRPRLITEADKKNAELADEKSAA